MYVCLLYATTNWAARLSVSVIKAVGAAAATLAAAVKKAADPTRACKVTRAHIHTRTERQANASAEPKSRMCQK